MMAGALLAAAAGALLPLGVRGLVVAGLLAALMSSLAGVFNASATLFTMDFYSRLRPKTSEHQLVWIGRIATVAMVLIGLAWIPVIRGGRGLYDYLQGVQAYLAPPIFVVFFLGIFWKHSTAKAAIMGMTKGLGKELATTGITWRQSACDMRTANVPSSRSLTGSPLSVTWASRLATP